MRATRLLYSPLMKTEENDDGTITVSGVASSESQDAAGETIKADAIRDALPGFLAYGGTGPLREMHQLSAAGTVDKAEINDDGETYIEATVVDPVACLKIRTGTYKGFSIGGKVLARDPSDRKVITKIRLSEISLVDRPCNPDAVFDVWKADAEDDPMKDAPGADAAAETVTESAQADATTTKAEATDTAAAPAETAADSETSPAADAVDETAAETGTETQAPTADASATDAGAEATSDEAAKADAQAPIDALAQAAAAIEALEATLAKASPGENLAKGMYSVSRFADLVESIASLVRSCEYEAEYEGDNSPVPPKMRAWLVAGATIFKEMAAEEIDELIADVTVKKAEEAAALTRTAEESALAKAATTAAADQETLLAKVAERDDALIKLAARVTPLTTAVEALTKRLAVVEAEPVPAKTAGTFAKAEAVSKEQDAPGTAAAPPASVGELSADALSKAIADLPDEERVLVLTKAALTRPISVQR